MWIYYILHWLTFHLFCHSNYIYGWMGASVSQSESSHLSAGLMTDLACRGLAAVAMSSGVQRWPGGAGCWGGKPGSSRRACSPARTTQDKYTLSSCLICLYRRFLIWNENFSFAIIIRAAGVVCMWRHARGLEGSWPGSAAEAGWSCAAAVSAAAAAWRSETQERHVHSHTHHVCVCTPSQ